MAGEDDEASQTVVTRDRRRDDPRLDSSLELMRHVRLLCLLLLAVMFTVAVGLTFMFDHIAGTRKDILVNREETLTNREETLRNREETLRNREVNEQTREAAEGVDAAFRAFTDQNAAFLDNHARTQRLICGWYRANNVPVPADCADR
jgi:hypothetical protein